MKKRSSSRHRDFLLQAATTAASLTPPLLPHVTMARKLRNLRCTNRAVCSCLRCSATIHANLQQSLLSQRILISQKKDQSNQYRTTRRSDMHRERQGKELAICRQTKQPKLLRTSILALHAAYTGLFPLCWLSRWGLRQKSCAQRQSGTYSLLDQRNRSRLQGGSRSPRIPSFYLYANLMQSKTETRRRATDIRGRNKIATYTGGKSP